MIAAPYHDPLSCTPRQGAIGACGAPLVGLTAERLFGFRGAVGVGSDPAARLLNADALAQALLVMLVGPWVLCLLAFSGMHWTYPRDCAAARSLRKTHSQADLRSVRKLELGTRRRRVNE